MIQYWIMLFFLFSVTLHTGNVQEFDTRWDEVLSSVSQIPSEDILESLYRLRMRESAQVKTVLELYNMEIHQKIPMPKNQKLKTMVKRSIDQKLRLRNFDARHGRLESGAVVEKRKGMSGVEGGKGTCYQWKEKASVRMETVAVSVTKPKIVSKNQNTMPRQGLMP